LSQRAADPSRTFLANCCVSSLTLQKATQSSFHFLMVRWLSAVNSQAKRRYENGSRSYRKYHLAHIRMFLTWKSSSNRIRLWARNIGMGTPTGNLPHPFVCFHRQRPLIVLEVDGASASL
jgi:hypothetical protein